MLDELFYVFQRLKTNDFDAPCIVTWEILHIALCHCTEWCRSEKVKENMLGDTYPCLDFRDLHDLECLSWVVYDGIFVSGRRPDLSGYHDWD